MSFTLQHLGPSEDWGLFSDCLIQQTHIFLICTGLRQAVSCPLNSAACPLFSNRRTREGEAKDSCCWSFKRIPGALDYWLVVSPLPASSPFHLKLQQEDERNVTPAQRIRSGCVKHLFTLPVNKTLWNATKWAPFFWREICLILCWDRAMQSSLSLFRHHYKQILFKLFGGFKMWVGHDSLGEEFSQWTRSDDSLESKQ